MPILQKSDKRKMWAFTALLLSLFLLCAPSSVCAAPQLPVNHQSFLDIIAPKRPIPTSIIGVNAFANDLRFGSIRSQYREVKQKLGLRYVRVLFAWNDQVQPSPSSPIDFSFYDEIARSIPPGVKAIVVLTGLPSWMSDSANWSAGNPRATFVEKWVSPVVARYRRRSRLEGYQVWNEPNDEANQDNTTLEIVSSPAAFAELTGQAYLAIKALAPRRRVISAATTAINQNFPETLDYNKALAAAGIENFIDVWAIHFYGSHYENVLRSGGLQDFLSTLDKPIWLTESGQKGTTKQKAYVERAWPFLVERVPRIARLYYYQMTDSEPAEQSYGLRTLTSGRTVSDLYQYLRDRGR